MSIWFIISIIGMLIDMPFLFLSVEHSKLEKWFGPNTGEKIGSIIGTLSGWMYFIFWIGIWIAPQPRFRFDLFNIALYVLPSINFSIPLFHLIIFIPFIVSGFWFGIMGVKELGLKVAETHYVEEIITKGIYSHIRHPQYFGGVLAHIGITFLLSAFYSLLSTPLIVIINMILAWKEEKELVKEFGNEYSEYKEKVPMFFPKILKLKKRKNKFN